jgi:geranylgeranyl diphosphate synthase type I
MPPREIPALSRIPESDVTLRSAPGAHALLSETRDTLLDTEIALSLADLEGPAPLLGHMIRFHLGLVNTTGEPVPADERRRLQGKRLRPAIAMQAAQSVTGNATVAAPLAAAIELLHNFTLIHDDIQDRSPNRRHRATVWRIWGDAQAINAGDALFAAAQLTLLRTPVPAGTLIELMREFNRTTVEIVQGQVLDVSFEGRADVTPDLYLEMIRRKTAAIVRFAAAGGAIVAGADAETAQLYADFGEALGIGFQIRDDLLGIWGDDRQTGKTRGDDIRRRKQSSPLLLLRASALGDDLARLDALAVMDEVPEEGIDEVFTMLDRYRIREQVEEQIESAHQRASLALQRLDGSATSGSELNNLLQRLATRTA